MELRINLRLCDCEDSMKKDEEALGLFTVHCISGGDFSLAFSTGYILRPVSGDKLPSSQANLLIIHAADMSKHTDSFKNETSDFYDSVS